MSMDAGGLAHMTYNSPMNGRGLGVPGSGFASRGKGSHIKRLSVPTQISSIDESQASGALPTPRTSRSHLLAGLRTAPKSATPSTAPLAQQQQFGRGGMDGGKYASQYQSHGRLAPQTATGAGFSSPMYSGNLHGNRQMYSLPEHVLAPPAIDLGFEDGDDMDEKQYAELVQTNLYLAAQQQRLQQQLLSVTAAAQQFQGLSLGLPYGMQQQQQQAQSPGYLNGGYYQQQLHQGMQPVVMPVPGQPGVYSVYNPMTGQQSFVMDNNTQQAESPPPAYQETVQSPVAQRPVAFRAEVSPPPENRDSSVHSSRSTSPPKAASPPVDVMPLPPPSANAFRRGHKKQPSSLATGIKTNGEQGRLGGPKSAGFPQTPLTGTFGPGQARAGEHPIRQPRGPPSLEELIAKPTSKYEGSKNFVTRQRRRAVHNLVRAGLERRGDSRGSPSGSGGSTPSSDSEFVFSVTEEDQPSRRSGSLSSKPSVGSLRAAASGAIGSERKGRDRSSRDRSSVDSQYTANTLSSDESGVVGGKLIEVHSDEIVVPSAAAVVAGTVVAPAPERRKMPMLVLSSAEKRKTPIM